MTKENLNTLWAFLLVDELVKNNLTYFCLSPGYRSAPLIHALSHHPQTEKSIQVDERAAAYHALGYAKGTGRAAVLVCTSGTALANYYPAVVEAFMDQVPMVILSADRPPEMNLTDANQTIDQIKFFGKYAKFFLSLAPPEPSHDPASWLGHIDRGVFLAHQGPRGPIHINCPFREPLDPVSQNHIQESPFYEKAVILHQSSTPLVENEESLSSDKRPGKKYLETLVEDLRTHTGGLLVVGREEEGPGWGGLVEELGRRLGWPVHYDITSSLKHGGGDFWDWDHPDCRRFLDEAVLQGKIQMVLHLGGSLVSKFYYQWLKKNPQVHLVRVEETAHALDASHRKHRKIISPLGPLLESLLQALPDNPPSGEWKTLREQLKEDFHLARHKLEHFPLSYLGLAYALSTMIPEDHILYLGNSTPIRAFEAATLGIRKKHLRVAAHRGVSGIEGLVAAATGYSQGTGKRVTLVLGDLGMLHDLNSLMLVKNCPVPLIVVVINNYGGGLFTRLPIAGFPQTLNPYILTPHEWNFDLVAAQFRLPYAQVSHLEDFKRNYEKALKGEEHLLMEVLLQNDKDNDIFREFYT